MSVGNVLREAWELYKRFFVRFVTVAAIVFVVIGLVNGLLALAADDGGLGAVLWSLIAVAVSLVGYFWLQGALVEAVRDVRDGRADASVGELFSRTQPRLPALIVAGILAGLAIAFGLLLLIIPGLFLLSRWFLIAPTIVLENRSAGESFGRSWELTRGHVLPALGLVVLTLLIAIVGGGIASALIEAVLAPLPDLLASWLASIIVNSLIAPFVALAWTLAYYRLAERPLEQPVTA
jgi:MFS family permease